MRVIDAREQHARRPIDRCPTCGRSKYEPPPEMEPLEYSVVEPRVRERCNAWMPRAGEQCGRSVGHRDSHRSRAVMDDESTRKRSTTRSWWT